MKSIVLLLLVIGAILIAMGYQKKMINTMETKTIVEYRFIPRSIYEEQFSELNLQHSFKDMFEKQDVFSKIV